MAANPFNITKQGSVASRFVSSSELTDAQKKKEDDLKAAYARIGQEPPPRPEKDEYDPRSLFERLQAQKNAKQEKFDETWKLSNQFRGIDEGESEFLAQVAAERKEEERRKREEERRELEEFKKAALAREAEEGSPPAAVSPPLPSTSTGTATPAHAPAPAAKRKRDKSSILGIKKKKTAAPKASLASKDEKKEDATPNAATGVSPSPAEKRSSTADDVKPTESSSSSSTKPAS